MLIRKQLQKLPYSVKSKVQNRADSTVLFAKKGEREECRFLLLVLA